jgi:transcriptional regulator with XRE-family HTH domain
MSIHENLRNLRLAANMTQEQAAEKVGLTRQGLSSYELGRTRPDIDMLKNLAELYGTDLDCVLYGKSRATKSLQIVKVVAIVLYVLFAVLTFAGSAFLWVANHFFEMPVGEMTEASAKIFEIRKRLTGAWEFIDGIILAISLIGLIFLLIFCASRNFRYSFKYRLIWAAACVATMLIIAFCFGITDKVFPVINYMITPINVAARFIIFMVLDLIIQKIQSRKSNSKMKF